MSYISVDVEADGPCPGPYSMVCFGAVVVDSTLDKRFYAEVQPISDLFIPEALAVSGFTREQHLQFADTPTVAMTKFEAWLRTYSVGKPTLVSDNPAFDWQWINHYFHGYIGRNPFGFSARRIGDIYCGLRRDMGVNQEWKKRYRKTLHDHNPVNDALGNAEALLAFSTLGLKI